MSVHIDTNDPKYKNAAAEILRRHDIGAPEANITTAVRDFLTVTGLVKGEEIDEENPLHVEVSEAGEKTATGAAKRLERLREERERVTVTIARRELRKWLRESPGGAGGGGCGGEVVGGRVGPARPVLSGKIIVRVTE